MIKAVIFDCFGVLLADTHRQRLTVLDQEAPEKAQELRSIVHAGDLGILSRAEIAEYAAKLLGIDPEEYLEEQDRGEVRNTELLAYIETLKNHYKLAVLSNVSSRERIGMRFEPGQLDALFNTVVASGDEGCVKPQPELYEIAATRLGVEPSECIFIDDVELYCEGARAVGMRALHFQTTRQCVEDLKNLLALDRGKK